MTKLSSSSLAIVIPAYKATFLMAALDSIAAQTCLDFTLYIGDDCSPDPIKKIVDKYKDKLKIVYKRFEDNLGGRDLVAQWERCINMTQGEPWIWLFSDDDMMECRCVETFYNYLTLTNSSYDLYHFNINIIDNRGIVIRHSKNYPQILDNYTFYKGKLSSKYASLVVENIFSRAIYLEKGGFKNFDLAWGSDTATWVLFSEKTGMLSMEGAYVLWRISDENISPNITSIIVIRKVKALLCFLEWGYHYFHQRGKRCLWIHIRAFLSRMVFFRAYLPDNVIVLANKRFCKEHGINILEPFLYCIIKYWRKIR